MSYLSSLDLFLIKKYQKNTLAYYDEESSDDVWKKYNEVYEKYCFTKFEKYNKIAA